MCCEMRFAVQFGGDCHSFGTNFWPCASRYSVCLHEKRVKKGILALRKAKKGFVQGEFSSLLGPVTPNFGRRIVGWAASRPTDRFAVRGPLRSPTWGLFSAPGPLRGPFTALGPWYSTKSPPFVHVGLAGGSRGVLQAFCCKKDRYPSASSDAGSGLNRRGAQKRI